MIEAMDTGIGKVLEQLEREGLDENTIVMFTSDNGPAFFNPPFMLEAGENPFNERFNVGLRGSKGWVYDGGIRIPMVLRWPAGLASNQFNYNLIHFTDWLPTLASMCEIDLITNLILDGFDVSAQLKGEDPAEEPRRFWQWNFYYPSIATNAAVREGNWKLVRPMISGTRFYANEELYVSKEDATMASAFIEADIKRKKNENGVLLAIGGSNVGLSLFIKDEKLMFDYNIFYDHKIIESEATVPEGNAKLGVYLERKDPEGAVTLLIDGEEAGKMSIPFVIRILGSTGMDIGRDSLSPVSEQYEAPFPFEGEITQVAVHLPERGNTIEQSFLAMRSEMGME